MSLTLNKGGVQVLNKPDVDGPCDPLSGELCADDIFDEGLKGVFNDLVEVADLQIKENRAIVTLIANVQESSNVMAVVFQVLSALGVQAEMISQGASKVNISVVVPGEVIQALHACFFEDCCLVPMRSPYEELVVTEEPVAA